MSESSGTQNISIVITDQVAASIQTKLDGISKSATTAQTTIDKLQAALNVLGANTAGLDKAAASLNLYNKSALEGAIASQKLATEQARTATTTATLATEQARTAVQTANAAAASDKAALAALRLQAAQDRASASADKLHEANGGVLESLLLFAGIGFGIEELVHLSDEYTNLQNKILSVATSQQDANEIFQALFKVANDTRAPIEQTVTSFQRLNNSVSALGGTQSETIQIVKTLNEAIALSGVNAVNAKNGILELDKAFGEGKLQGQQLRSILLDTPLIAQQVAKNITLVDGVVKVAAGGIGISIGQFRELATQGKITSEVLAQGLLASAPAVQIAFARLNPTLAGSNGALNVLKNTFENIIGSTNRAIQANQSLANGVLSLASTINASFANIGEIGATLLVVFGPALIAALAAATLAIVQFGLALALTTPLGLLTVGLYAAIFIVEQFTGSFKSAVTAVGLSLIAIAAEVAGMVSAIKTIVEEIPDIFSNAFTEAYDQIIAPLHDIDNAVIGVVNKLRGGLGEALLTPEKIDVLPWKNVGANIGQAFNDGANSVIVGGATGFAKLLNGFGNAGTDLLNKPGTKLASPATPEKASAAEKAQDALEKSILKTVDPLNTYNLALSAANDLLAKGQINQTQYNQELAKAKFAYEEAADPLFKTNQQLNQQLEILKLLPTAQAAAQQIQQIQNGLDKDGITLTNQQTEALKAKVAQIDAATKASQAQAALLGNADNKKFGIDASAIVSLQGNSKANFGAGDAATATSNLISQAGLDPKGLQVQANSYTSIYQKMYADIATLRSKDLISEQDAQALKLQVAIKQSNQQLETSKEFFGDLASLSHSSNSELAAIGKAASIAQAIINTYQSATAAYSALAAVPVVGPELGAAAAAAAIVAGLANVAQIKSQPTGFAAGGYTGNLPTNSVAGVVHGQEYVLDAASVSRIGVGNLEALRNGAASVAQTTAQAGTGQATQSSATNGQSQSQGPQSASLTHRNINILDPKIVGDFMSTPEGETATINLIRRNRSVIKRTIG
jgi:tape measure domain-containing protein